MSAPHVSARLALASNASLYAGALKRAISSDDVPGSLDTLRRLGRVIAEAAHEADAFEVERAAIDLAADSELSVEQVELLIGLLENVASDPTTRQSVLLVEDDPTSAFALSSGLRRANLAMTVVGSLAEAASYLEENVPQFVILDLFLPDGDGRSLLADMRSDPRTSQTHTVVVSGTDHDLARSECYALGADAFLTKPVDPDELERVLATLRRTPHRTSNTLSDRARLLHEFTMGRSQQTVAMLRFHPIEGAGAPTDAFTVDRLARKVAARLTDIGPVAAWSDELYCTVLNRPPADAVTLLDAIRVGLRHIPADGGPHTFSAGVADGGRGTLLEVCSLASRRLWEAMAEGGDRVAAPGSIGRPAILVAEDDRVVAALVVARLEEAGFDVRHVTNGRKALDALADDPPALLLLDVNMPETDGFAVLEEVRASERWRGIPVIMLTGEEAEAQVVRAFALGADDYVVKPFSPAELTARVIRSLS